MRLQQAHQPMTHVLNSDILADFERALRSVDAAITRAWQPGLDDDQIDALVQPLGLDLPDEARTWWRWHDGCPTGTHPAEAELTPRRPLFDLVLTLDDFESFRGATLQLEGSDARLQPVGDQPWIFFACDGPRDAPVPIYVGGHGEGHRLALPSIGELVLTWTRLIDEGGYTTDADGLWEWDFEKIPEDIRRIGVY
jgi:hypothetical protein